MKATLAAAGPTVRAAARAEDELTSAAPHLMPAFAAQLARAADVVTRRLVGAAAREGVAGQVEWDGDRAFLPLRDGGFLVATASRHAFGRAEVAQPLELDPAELVRRIAGDTPEADALGAELSDAVVGLALAYARADGVRNPAPGGGDSIDRIVDLPADAACLALEQLATEGHNLHPCGRTRLGWSMADRLAYDLESPGLDVRYVALHKDFHLGDDVGPEVPGVDRSRYVVTPVHPWQWEQVIRRRYADLVRDGAIRPLDLTTPGQPTAALRTVLTGQTYLKLSLDILVTSTRRSISVASTRNARAISDRLTQLLDQTGLSERVLLMTETAGSAGIVSGRRDRDLAAIVRSGLSTHLGPGEVPVPGGALCAVSPETGRSVVAELVDRYASTRALPGRSAAAAFLVDYANLLLEPVLTLAGHGVGLEAHLQNCVPTFVDGVPQRLGLRDLAGLRLHLPRLANPPTLWPGSVVVSDLDTMLAKVAYTALQAHLGELVIRLGESHDLPEPAAWATIRSVVDQVFDSLAARPTARADHAFFTGPTLPHKALLSMRLAALRGQAGDLYVRVENPLR